MYPDHISLVRPDPSHDADDHNPRQLPWGELESNHASWAVQTGQMNEALRRPSKLSTLHGTSLSSDVWKSNSASVDMPFLREIGQAREELVRFRSEMNGLAQQMNGMENDLRDSRNRVLEIEQDLTAAQEVNVVLQVLLERAVSKQRESDVRATRTMRHIHANLATVAHETNQMQDRLETIESCQREHKGSVDDVEERIREYTHMLEQAQGTIQSLQDSRSQSADIVVVPRVAASQIWRRRSKPRRPTFPRRSIDPYNSDEEDNDASVCSAPAAMQTTTPSRPSPPSAQLPISETILSGPIELDRRRLRKQTSLSGVSIASRHPPAQGLGLLLHGYGQ